MEGGGNPSPPSPVLHQPKKPGANRVKQNLKYWEDIGASDFIISMIGEGYKIPFIDSPEPAEFKNNRSAIHKSEFVSDSLRALIASKRVVEVPF